MADEPKSHARRLTPSAALTRFNPPPGTLMGIAPAERARVRYGFRVGGLGLLIGPNTVSEVMEKMPIYALPQTPLWLAGLINLRGNLVPVFDLGRALELSQDSPEKQRILVLDRGDKALGILIDGLPQAPALGRALARLPPLPGALRPYVDKAYLKEGKIWLEFEHQGFFRALAAELAPTT